VLRDIGAFSELRVIRGQRACGFPDLKRARFRGLKRMSGVIGRCSINSLFRLCPIRAMDFAEQHRNLTVFFIRNACRHLMLRRWTPEPAEVARELATGEDECKHDDVRWLR
jgi:hypothetical protein